MKAPKTVSSNRTSGSHREGLRNLVLSITLTVLCDPQPSLFPEVLKQSFVRTKGDFPNRLQFIFMLAKVFFQ